MKVPIDVENDEVRDEEPKAEEAVQDEQEDEATYELTPEEEAAMVEAAKRAGAAAAEEEMQAEAKAEAEHTNEDASEEVEDLQSQLEAVQAELEKAKKDAAAANDRMLRLQADWENYRRRTAGERLAEKERAAEKLVTNLLPVLDDMERATAHATQTAEGDEKVTQFVEGVTAVHTKMLDILGKENVEVIDPVGEPFDPLIHQAVGRVEDAEAYEETVAQVYQKGYRMGGKVIRSAMVTVTYGGPKRPAPEQEAAK